MWGVLLLACVAAALLLILFLPKRCAPGWITALLLATLAPAAAYVWRAKENADFTFFFALPCAFLRDENIVVNSIDDLAPRWVPSLKRIADALAVVILAVMSWQGFIAAVDSYAFHDVTADLALPRIWHWLALLSASLARPYRRSR